MTLETPSRLEPSSPIRHAAIALCLVLWPLATRCDVWAGVGPENVIIVVNADSQISRTVANHYVQLRDIPSTNVVMLEGVPGQQLKIGLDQFKTSILLPVLKQINLRGLAAQTRVIAYSADFPTSVDISPHTEKLTDDTQKKHQRPTASISGLTFLYRFVLADNPSYLSWYSNLYCRGPFERSFANPFGGETRERFAGAEEDLAEGRAAEAAEIFRTLLDKHPSLSPLAIRAAEAYAAADDSASAKQMIRRAVSAGWRSARYLKESDSLAPFMDDSELAAIQTQLSDLPLVIQPPVGFVAGNRGWTNCGHSAVDDTHSIPYLMSCMLAVVHARGSTTPQAVEVLERGSRADQTFPQSPFWFTRTKDVRTTTRFPLIGDALLWLKQLGYEGELIHSAMPTKPGKCAGLMLGTAKMSLAGQDWAFVPGAIADNLTSLNGSFGSASQTKMTELLHAGAAMTSGPVDEPYAIQAKFPMPMMYGFYASGVSAIEAFYLSVRSPYQLLIVGDPLCQPFARCPLDLAVVTPMHEPNRAIRISRQPIRFDAPQKATATAEIEVFVEGRQIRVTPPVDNIQMEIPDETSGKIEVRTVFVGDDPTEPRSWFSNWVDTKGPLAVPVATQQSTTKDATADVADVKLVAADAESIELMHHAETVAVIDGSKGTVQVSAERLGSGPVRLRPVAKFGDQKVPGKPIVVQLLAN